LKRKIPSKGTRKKENIMSKKTLFKAAAIVICFAFLSLSFPGITDARPRSPKLDFANLIKKPVFIFSSLLSFLPIFDTGIIIVKDENPEKPTEGTARITDGLPSRRVGDGN
jgi:hypothetical protein